MDPIVEQILHRLEGEGDIKTIFIDVDHTLINANSGSVFARYLCRRGLITMKELSTLPWHTLLYAFGVLDYSVIIEKSLKAWKGKSVKELTEEGKKCYHSRIRHKIFRQTRELLDELKRRQILSVLISASPRELLQHFSEDLGGVELITTGFEIVNDRFTGKLQGPFCYGEGKVELAKAYLSSRGDRDLRYAAMSDSISDKPLLESAALPIVVNSDFRLKSWCRQHGHRHYKFNRD